jgi:hypothetical protein
MRRRAATRANGVGITLRSGRAPLCGSERRRMLRPMETVREPAPPQWLICILLRRRRAATERAEAPAPSGATAEA